MIESPRWLLSRGRVTECLQQLNKIAKVNGTTLSPNSSQLLQNSVSIPEKVYGAGSLFSSLRLAKNTTLLLLAWYDSLIFAMVYEFENNRINQFQDGMFLEL